MIDMKQRLELPSVASLTYHSLPLLEKKGVATVSRLPVSLRIVLEAVLRNLDGQRIRDEDVEALARWRSLDEEPTLGGYSRGSPSTS